MSLLLLLSTTSGTPTVNATATGSWGGISASAGDTQFDPLSLSPNIWLDASDTSTITYGTGSLVNSWADKSGNGKTITRISGSGVNSGLTTLNGKNLVDFTTATKLFRASTAADWKFLTDGTPTIIAMVVKPATTDDPGTVNYPILSVGNWNQAYNTFVLLWSDSTTAGLGDRIRTYAANGTAQVVSNISSGGAMQANRFAALTVFHDGDASPASARSSIYVNDSSAIANNTSTGTVSSSDPAQPLTIGSSLNSGFFAGSIGEIIIITGVNATEANRDALYKYLRTKWMYPAVITEHSVSAASSMGGWSASAVATKTVNAASSGSWQAQASASASVDHFATASAAWGALTGTAFATHTHYAAGEGLWGGLSVAAAAEHFVPAVCDGSFGSLSATASALKTVHVYAASAWFGDLHAYASPFVLAFPLGEWGAWAASSSAEKTVQTVGTGSWGGLSASSSLTVTHAATASGAFSGAVIQASAAVEVFLSASLTADSTLSASATPEVLASCSYVLGSVVGTASADVEVLASGSLTSSATLYGAASTESNVTANASWSAQTWTAQATVEAPALVEGSWGGVSASSAASVTHFVAGSLTSYGHYTASALVAKEATGSLTGIAVGSASATVTVTATASFSGSWQASSAATVSVVATGSLSSSMTLAASANIVGGEVLATGSLQTSSSLSATSVVERRAHATGTWSGTFTGAASVTDPATIDTSWGATSATAAARVTKFVIGSGAWSVVITANAVDGTKYFSKTYVHNGTQWVKAVPKVWDGSKWVPSYTAKVWDSEHSMWIPMLEQPS